MIRQKIVIITLIDIITGYFKAGISQNQIVRINVDTRKFSYIYIYIYIYVCVCVQR